LLHCRRGPLMALSWLNLPWHLKAAIGRVSGHWATPADQDLAGRGVGRPPDVGRTGLLAQREQLLETVHERVAVLPRHRLRLIGPPARVANDCASGSCLGCAYWAAGDNVLHQRSRSIRARSATSLGGGAGKRRRPVPSDADRRTRDRHRTFARCAPRCVPLATLARMRRAET